MIHHINGQLVQGILTQENDLVLRNKEKTTRDSSCYYEQADLTGILFNA